MMQFMTRVAFSAVVASVLINTAIATEDNIKSENNPYSVQLGPRPLVNQA